jgi:hypothetical protein
MVDVVTFHYYANLTDGLNVAARIDNVLDPARDIVAGNTAWHAKDADMGMSGLLEEMKKYQFGRDVRIAISEHCGAINLWKDNMSVHSVETGLFQLMTTHFMLYAAGDVASSLFSNSFIFDWYGDLYDFPHYKTETERNYQWYALYIRNNLCGRSGILRVSQNGFLNDAGYPYLVVTASTDERNIFVEVINRAVSEINDSIYISGGESIADTSTVYRMFEEQYLDSSTGPGGQAFEASFPPLSATICKIPAITTAARYRDKGHAALDRHDILSEHYVRMVPGKKDLVCFSRMRSRVTVYSMAGKKKCSFLLEPGEHRRIPVRMPGKGIVAVEFRHGESRDILAGAVLD